MPEVIIIGSGLAGLSAATRLMEQGFDITLYEQNNFLGGKQTRQGLTNAGSLATVLTNMFNGVAPPADQFISAYSLLDLIGAQAMSGKVLEQTSVNNFFRTRGYSTD